MNTTPEWSAPEVSELTGPDGQTPEAHAATQNGGQNIVSNPAVQ